MVSIPIGYYGRILRLFDSSHETEKEFINNAEIRDQQWTVFSQPISNHVILSMSESTVLKFNYSDSFIFKSTKIYKYRLQWVWVERWHQTHNIRNIFDSYVYPFRLIDIRKIFSILINETSDSNHSSTFIVLADTTFTRKGKRKIQK